MNVASRLVNIAKRGEIIISEETYRKVADRVEAEAMPPVKVKGKEKEQKIYRFIALKHAPEIPPAWVEPRALR